MQIESNIEHLNKIKQSLLATKYPHLISAALTYTLLHRREAYLNDSFYTWFPWHETKEGRKYWIDISRNLDAN